MTETIVDFWRRFAPSIAGNIHPDDAPYFPNQSRFPPEFATQTHFLPQPYVGDLARADIFAILLGPGVSSDDEEWLSQEHFRDVVLTTLHQPPNREHPFDFFNPAFEAHPGGRYFRQRIGRDTIQKISLRFALVELYPYHSKRFEGCSWQTTLPSFEIATSYVKETLVPRATRDEICLIIIRGALSWAAYT